jgi:hypothetical protein
MSRRLLIAAVLAAAALGAGAKEIWDVQDFVMTVGMVDGAPLKVLRDASRKTNCYFWKGSLSCVRE